MKKTLILSLILITIVIAAGCAPEAPAISLPPDPSISIPTAALSSAATTATGTTTANDESVVVPAPVPPPGMTLDPLQGRSNAYSVEIDLIPSKPVYLPGEQIDMKLVLTNASTGDVEPVVVTSLPPVVSLVRTGTFSGPARPPGVSFPSSEAGRSGAVKTFPAGNGEKTLAKGEKLTYDLTWDQKDKDGTQVSPGWYNYESNCNYHPESSENNVGSGVSKRAFLIQYPQGAMTRIIEVNESRTLNSVPLLSIGGETRLVDVIITLERVELNELGAAFYLLMSSPNNPVDGYNNPEWMSRTPNPCRYIIDGVTHEARYPVGKYLDNGIEFRWGASPDDDNYLDPVPSDAQELTLVISEIGHGWEGPWEFDIPLESTLPFKASIGIFNNQENFLPGDEVMYGISITNLSSGIITIDPYGPAMQIRSVDRNEVVYSSPAGSRTQDIVTEYPMSWYRTKGIWDQKDNQGRQVPPGWYEIGYEYVIIEQSTGKSFKADLKTSFQIVPPDSAMNKDLEINQSVTAGGVAVTLEIIEMNAVETKIYTFTTPPDYSLTTEHPPSQMESLMTNSTAEYSVDGGAVVKIRSGGGKADAEGITLTWDNLDPMPVEAKEITFIITQLGGLKGPWEFKVKLY